jgi:hypothetical protein
MNIFRKTDYYHIVTFSVTKGKIESRYQRVLKTKRLVPTVSEWNDFTDSLPFLKEAKNSWVVMNIVTLSH